MTDDQAAELLDSCGRAFGFTLAMALNSGTDFSNKADVTAFAMGLHDLLDSERFSPDVTLVMSGITAGLNSVVTLTNETDQII